MDICHVAIYRIIEYRKTFFEGLKFEDGFVAFGKLVGEGTHSSSPKILWKTGSCEIWHVPVETNLLWSFGAKISYWHLAMLFCFAYVSMLW